MNDRCRELLGSSSSVDFNRQSKKFHFGSEFPYKLKVNISLSRMANDSVTNLTLSLVKINDRCPGAPGSLKK